MIFLPDPKYNPMFQTEITSKTKLAPGISIAKFLGGHGDSVTLDHITNKQDRYYVARHLYVHAEIMRSVSVNRDIFEDYRLVVAEGLYRKGGSETLTPDSLNDLATKGRCVVYELYNERGEIAVSKTFDLAVYWKDNIKFEKMILDYDRYNPDNSLNVQIIVTLPEISRQWSTEFSKNLETRYNNVVQSSGELVEIFDKKPTLDPSKLKKFNGTLQKGEKLTNIDGITYAVPVNPSS
jgi:hypothetical protein